ncbi:hypothetical protein CPJCM30710_29570 [Clostridium polyendosporum]|uniref:Lipoprotein n=1 Tax=Clostridium polyendosporum TaxID=69208 RepID=A0A919S1M5_9CLOT|nr:hypothetical protein [Clostridium polyendosporum]GIM30291.1 hypothetical protein CPJCM30710_29570 [Clostridium polyendosporum]
MKNRIGSIIIILLSLFIISCGNNYVEPQKKLPKTDDKLLYIMISKYSTDGNKTIGVNDTLDFKAKEERVIVEDILKVFKNKEHIGNEIMENPQYRIIFLYNLDPEQSKVREEFMESDRFEIVDKEGLLIENEETKETFKIQGDNYKKLSKYLKLLD